MKRETEEKLEKEAKQIGIDLLIVAIIFSLVLGFAAGILVN